MTYTRFAVANWLSPGLSEKMPPCANWDAQEPPSQFDDIQNGLLLYRVLHESPFQQNILGRGRKCGAPPRWAGI